MRASSTVNVVARLHKFEAGGRTHETCANHDDFLRHARSRNREQVSRSTAEPAGAERQLSLTHDSDEDC